MNSVKNSEVKAADVVIIGAGPVGLVAACLLRQQGVEVLVIERRSSLPTLPQAHVISTRTMEIFREIGIAQQVQDIAAPLAKMQAITWCESLTGRRFGALSFIDVDPAELEAMFAASPTHINNLAQNKLQPILLEQAIKLGAQVRFNLSAKIIKQSNSSVSLMLSDQRGGRELRANWVIACDGAASQSRTALGIQMIGPKSIRKFLSIYFQADLGSCFENGMSGPVHWILGREVRGFLIGFDLKTTWALMVPFDDPHCPNDFNREICTHLVRKAIGSDTTKFTIENVSHWNMSGQVAERFQEHRVFLAGDAAHRFPPTGGMGLNTGVQDVHNLAWKIASIIKSQAPHSLLLSYESERKPVAQRNCAHSLNNAENMALVEQAIGASAMAPVSPDAGSEKDAPRLELGLDGNGAVAVNKRKLVADAIQAQREHFSFQGLDLGFTYSSLAISHDGINSGHSTVSRYLAVSDPGARLPHIWLGLNEKKVSSLDLVGGRFVLLAGARADNWFEAGSTFSDWLQVWQIGRDGLTDPEDQWSRQFSLTLTQALLVRPDGHIAWRSPQTASNPLEQLRNVIAMFKKQILEKAI